ncbi:MAG: hypothetical protein IJX19_12875, partial [Clostridia bacterium]|nr:hypothetical protein [Clostridia bacterium]
MKEVLPFPPDFFSFFGGGGAFLKKSPSSPKPPSPKKTFKKGILEKMVVFVRWNGMGFESKLRDFGETNNQRVILSGGRRVTP